MTPNVVLLSPDEPAGAARAPLPPSVPRPVKRAGGRGSPIPAHVRIIGVQIGDEDRDYIRRKLGMKLAKFAGSVQRVSVRLTDVNGPRGGVDQECRIKVVLQALPSVVVVRQNAALRAAIDAALRAMEQAVQRAVRRRLTKPLHTRRPSRRVVKAPQD